MGYQKNGHMKVHILKKKKNKGPMKALEKKKRIK